MKHVIYNTRGYLFYSFDFSWCNLLLATRYDDEEKEVFGSDPPSLPENCIWMTEEEALLFEAIPWETIIIEEISCLQNT